MKKLYRFLPKYAVIPILITVILNMMVYWGNNLITSGMKHYNLSTWLDRELPLITPMILIYVLAYVTWAVGYIIIGRESREVCYECFSGEQIAKLICLILFIAIPTVMVRPEITGDSFFDWGTKLIYSLDEPKTLFPSIHCLENWFVFRGALRCKKVGKGYKTFMFISAILVFASTVLVKQHLVVDIPAGIIVCEIGLYIAKKFKVSRIYYALENKMEKHEE